MNGGQGDDKAARLPPRLAEQSRQKAGSDGLRDALEVAGQEVPSGVGDLYAQGIRRMLAFRPGRRDQLAEAWLRRRPKAVPRTFRFGLRSGCAVRLATAVAVVAAGDAGTTAGTSSRSR